MGKNEQTQNEDQRKRTRNIQMLRQTYSHTQKTHKNNRPLKLKKNLRKKHCRTKIKKAF